MKNALIIYGSYGNPNENWFPWLKSELEKIGYKVNIPHFPTPENQSLETWNKVFEEYNNTINSETILIGHSLGPAFILQIIENLKEPIKAAFFVSSFLGKLNNPEFDEINKSFFKSTYNWEQIRNNCKNFLVIHSDNDPYVPLEKAQEISTNLNSKLIVVNKAGHFNEDSGYTSFNLLLEKIENL